MPAQHQNLRNKLANLPDQPGVYIMKDMSRNVIYVGKASSLKKRVSSYFQKTGHDPKTRVLVGSIADLEYIITDSEIEALLLENSLIKKHKPKYNIRLKDDKRYPYIAVTLNEEYPRVIFTRRITGGANRYFGPYTDAKAVRSIVSTINSIFKLKTCTKNIPLKKNERSCLNYQIHRCLGVCQGALSRDEYMKVIESAIHFLEGHIEPVLRGLQTMMDEYSRAMNYERAAQIRDIIRDIEKISEDQKVFSPVGTDQDFIQTTIQGNEAVTVLFEFRGGILLGRKVFIFDNAAYAGPEDVIQAFIVEYYSKYDIPPRIVTPHRIADRSIIEAYCAGRAAKKVAISPPRSSEDRGILNMMQKNIDMIIVERDASRRSADTSAALEELRSLLRLEKIPQTMECFDISNTQGKNPVASMVRFHDGMPDKKNYRRYKIRAYDSSNDPGMIHEAVGRRIQHLVNEGLDLPDLIVIDGGPAQLSRAMEIQRDFNIPTAFISLAKRFEEIYFNPSSEPLRLEEGSPALKIVQRIRDEAHRFAITYHRKLRGIHATASILDGIPNIGEKKKGILMRHIAEPLKIRDMPLHEIEAIPGIGRKTAAEIYNHFHPAQQPDANTR